MKIVCLGDSLTAGYNIRPQDCWVSLLNDEGSCEWINRGICGDTTAGMLVRLERDVLAESPEMVLIMGGDNDILISAQSMTARANIMAMVQHCVHSGIKPVIGIPYEIRFLSPEWLAAAGDDIDALHRESAAFIAWLRSYVKAFSLRHVDFDAAFSESKRTGLIQPDGLHPTVAGNERMAEAVRAALLRRH
ncbi:MAG: GDSL family lipase [Lachnospiraceae bacterium]|nr:GDSL family lipase [Lachnospiraceae bacterium]